MAHYFIYHQERKKYCQLYTKIWYIQYSDKVVKKSVLDEKC